MFYFIRNFERQKLKQKKIFCNAGADANISKWSRETIVSYLGTKIQVQKIESEHYHYSLSILKLLIGIAFDFSKARKLSQKVENSMALSDFVNVYTCFYLITIFFTLTLCTCCTKNYYVLYKKLCCVNKKNISHISENIMESQTKILWKEKK